MHTVATILSLAACWAFLAAALDASYSRGRHSTGPLCFMAAVAAALSLIVQFL